MNVLIMMIIILIIVNVADYLIVTILMAIIHLQKKI